MSARLCAIAAGLGLIATPALAANAAVDSLLALCAPNRAEAGAVFAAAEADGWTMRSSCTLPRTNDARAGGPIDTLETAPCNLFRTKTVDGARLQLLVIEEEVSWENGPHRVRRCAVLDANATMTRLTAAATAALNSPPQPSQGPNTAWIWAEGANGRAFLPPVTEALLNEAIDKGPLYAVQIEPTDGAPTLVYSELKKIGSAKP